MTMRELSLIDCLPEIVNNGRNTVKNIINRAYYGPEVEKYRIIPNHNKMEIISKDNRINSFYQGDNLIVMEKLIEDGYRDKIDLIYIDPPFLTNVNYKGKVIVENESKGEIIEYFAYKDTWDGGMVTYLENLYIRLSLMKELLSPQGTIYVHLDFRTVHYVKVLMDEIFGEENFLNEIIWAYKSGGSSRRYYARKHDNILVYTKTKDYIFNPQLEKSYNRDFKPYNFKGVEEFQDEIGWYTMVRLKDVWNINMVGRTSKERLGYSTQKPEKLLERIILTSSNENSLVGDFFAGSGTTGIVAEKNNRKWVMVDKGSLSKTIINNRLIENKSSPYNIYILGDLNKEIGKLFIKKMDIIENKEGEMELNLELDRYELDIDKISIDKKYIDLMKNILKNNSLALLDFIGIDVNYQGNTPNLNWQFYRTKEKLTLERNIKIKDPNLRESEMILLKIIDIFGHESKILLKL